jgi:hypothetical protein
VQERLAADVADVASGLVRCEQRRNAELYARGLIEAGARKSLESMVTRLGGGPVQYEGLEHFLADSPWDCGVVERAVAEGVCAVIEPAAWVLDDTGVPKDGKRSPGVKRVLRDAWEDRQLPDRGLAACRQSEGHGPIGLSAVSARGLLSGPGAAQEGEDPRGR